MNFLEQRILQDGIVKPGNVLKVDSFLNHQMDMALVDEIGKEFHRRFRDKPITKVLTIESSGIAIADAYIAEIESVTQKKTNLVVVSKKFLTAEDHVLIVDDFLANGYALQGLISLVEAAEGTVEGLGIAIEKSFQDGGYRMRNLGYHLESIAIISSMDPETGAITFAQPDAP